MTLDGKIIQKEGARKVTIGILMFLMKFKVSSDDPIPICKDGCSQDKVNNELTFPFVETLFYMINSYYSD